jgi:AcrR family transcriptional regulator
MRASLKPRRAPTQERSRARVAKILEATAALLDEKGLEGVTTNAIAKRARLPVGTLYQFFPNREAILLALADSRLEELDARFVPMLERGMPGSVSPRVLVGAVLRALREAYVNIPGLAALVGTTQGHPVLERAYELNNDRLVARIAQALLQRTPALAPRAQAIAAMLVEACDAVVRKWLRARARGRPEDLGPLEELEEMLSVYLAHLDAAEGSPRIDRKIT